MFQENQVATTKVTIKVPKLHSKVKGNIENAYKKIQEQNKTFHDRDDLFRFEKISTDTLFPLDRQRDTKTTWCVDRLKALGGFDWLAFGTLFVVLDKNDNKYYVWDGCGRLALAQLHFGSIEVPCLVTDGTQQELAKYFAYNQDDGRRTLSKEVLFGARYESGDPQAQKDADLLGYLGLYTKNDADPVPVPNINDIEIKFRTFDEGKKISGNDRALQKQVRDMIATAWESNKLGCTMIHQDVYWALIFLLKFYSNFRSNGCNEALQEWLTNVARNQQQNKVKWKPKSLSGNAGVAPTLALALYEDFRSSDLFTAYIAGKNRIELLRTYIADRSKDKK